MSKVVSAAQARANFSEILTQAGYAGKETVIERNNRPVAVVIGYEAYQELMAMRRDLRERQARFEIYDEIRARNADVNVDQVAADVAQAVKAVRQK